MLRFDDIVFGPIRSRRLGSSLGINLLPRDGKLCNFDCVYCECGWNADGRSASSMPSVSEFSVALEQKLEKAVREGTGIDSITFSGSGEPTLNPDFPSIVDETLRLRNKYMPGSRVSVLSNATTLSDPAVVGALKKVDNPILKLDAPTDDTLRAINRPSCSCSVAEKVAGMKQFDGNFILQTMFLGGPGPDYARNPELLNAWMDIVRELKPRLVMVYTLDRPAPLSSLEKYSPAQMRTLLTPLFEEGFNIQING